MKKLFLSIAIFIACISNANSEYLLLVPEHKCYKDENGTYSAGASDSIIEIKNRLSDNVYIVRLIQSGLPLYLMSNGVACIDSGLVSMGNGLHFNDGIAIVDGNKLTITFTSTRKADEGIYGANDADISSLIQMNLSYVDRYNSYQLNEVILLEKLVSGYEQITINEHHHRVNNVMYGFAINLLK